MSIEPPPPDVKDRVRASYNHISKTYLKWTKEEHYESRVQILDDLFELMPKLTSSSYPSSESGEDEEEKEDDDDDASDPIRVVDLGSGDCDPVIRGMLCRNPAIHATINDISELQLDAAKANLTTPSRRKSTSQSQDRIAFIRGDMMDLSFPENSLSVVVALYCFIHLPQDEQEELIQRAARWLEPGGCLLANFAGVEMEGYVIEHWLQEGGWMFFSGLGYERTAQCIDDAGLVVLKERIDEGTPERMIWVVAMKG